MGKQAFEKKIEALESLRSSPGSPSILVDLRKALRDRNNYLVSKAAALAGEFGLRALVPDLLATFDRFMADAAKTDPQCWAKNAVVKALKDLGHDDPAVFLRGLAHVQMEPVWKGRQDTAATLRGACALALVQCVIDPFEILTRLTDVLVDPEKPARIDAARAIAQLSRPESTLLLRLKALVGDEDSEVTGQCFYSLLDLAPRDSLAFMARFLDADSADLQLEAIAALSECREPGAMEIIKAFWNKQRDPELKAAILMAVGASRQAGAADFLASLVADGTSQDAGTAITALAAGRFRQDVRDRVAAAVERRGDPKLTAVFEKEFADRK